MTFQPEYQKYLHRSSIIIYSISDDVTEGLRMIWAGLGPIPLALPNRRLGSPGEKNSREKTGPQKPSRDALSLAACRALCPPTGVSRGALGDPLSAWLPRVSWTSGGPDPPVMGGDPRTGGIGLSRISTIVTLSVLTLSPFQFLLCHTPGSLLY